MALATNVEHHQQVRIPPYLDYVAYAKREERGTVIMFNVEGRTLQESLERVKMAIDQRGQP